MTLFDQIPADAPPCMRNTKRFTPTPELVENTHTHAQVLIGGATRFVSDNLNAGGMHPLVNLPCARNGRP